MTATTVSLAPGDVVTRRMTRWYNPTDNVQRVEFIVSEAKLIRNHVGDVVSTIPLKTESFEVPPHGEADIPKIYDNAIQRIVGGVVLAGQAPLLLHPDRTTVKIHPSLIPAREDARVGISRDDLIARLRGDPTHAAADDPDSARVARARQKARP